MTLQTRLIAETESGWTYEILLPDRSRPGPLRFSVTPKGALSFDNRQPQARACRSRRASRLLAAEMEGAARERVPGALAGRSQKGLALELRAHYYAYRIGFFRRHAANAELGSPNPAAPDYDANAALFEHPLRGLPAVLKALRRGARP